MAESPHYPVKLIVPQQNVRGWRFREIKTWDKSWRDISLDWLWEVAAQVVGEPAWEYEILP